MAKRSGLQAGQPRSRRGGSGGVSKAEYPGPLSGCYLPRCVLLSLGACVGMVVSATAAQAQCSSSANPSPPQPMHADSSNVSFGPPRYRTFLVFSTGLVGCLGPQAGYDEPGIPGSPGQPGGQISSTNTNVEFVGRGFQVPPYSFLTSAPILSQAALVGWAVKAAQPDPVTSGAEPAALVGRAARSRRPSTPMSFRMRTRNYWPRLDSMRSPRAAGVVLGATPVMRPVFIIGM